MWQLDWSKLAEVLTYDPQQPMIFNSGLFLFLFLGFSLVYALLQKKMTARLLFVTAFSYYCTNLPCPPHTYLTVPPERTNSPHRAAQEPKRPTSP